MLGVCDGGEKIKGGQGHILCCDAHKSETEIILSPLNKAQMDKIAYDKDGRIYTNPVDEKLGQIKSSEMPINKGFLEIGSQ